MATFNNFEESSNGKAGRKKSDVAILGVPFDMGAVGLTGQREGPDVIRSAGYWSQGMRHAQTGADPMELLDIVDVGDIEITPGATDRAHQDIRAKVREVYSNTRCLISLGGDQSASAKIISGVADLDRDQVTVFHLDSSPDCWKHDVGSEFNNESWVRHIIETGQALRVVQFGLRGWGLPATDARWATKNDVYAHYSQDGQWQKQFMEELEDTAGAIYLSIDMSVLDPAFAPAVSSQEPGGITTRELFWVIAKVINSGRMVAMDVMELVPMLDLDGSSAKVANRLVAHALTTLAVQKHQG